MAADLSKAKRLFQNERFQQCKDNLLGLCSKYPANVRIWQKLGDVCFKLNQINEAKRYYRRLSSLNDEALDASAAKALFQFGRFLFDNNQPDEAAELLDKCLQIQDSAAAHYYLGFIHRGRSDVNQAIYHLGLASRIQPNVVRYHLQLAKCLQSAGRYDAATKSYEKSMELTEHRDAEILNEYSHFQYHCTNNKQLALDFAQLAAAHDERFSLKLKMQSGGIPTATSSEEDQVGSNESNDCKVRNTRQKTKTEHNINYSSLKCMIYDFDAAIQYLSLEENVSSDVNNLEMMYIKDFLYIFGLRDRINRLRNHFEKLQSIKIQIGLYIPRNDIHYRDLVIAALRRAYLYSYFEFIEDPNSIHGVAKRLQLKDDELLLISGRGDYPCPQRFGLSLEDLEFIENNLGFDVEMHTILNCNITVCFLSQRNFKLYRDLRMQILRHSYHDSQGVDSLDAIRWIKQDSTESKFVDIWREFADKFMFITYNSHIHHVWTALAVLETLLEVEPDDPELLSQRATFLNCLARFDEAEIAFRKCMANPRNPKVYVDFGYFFYQQERYEEAEDTFLKALETNPSAVKANIGLARVLEKRRRFRDAEYHYLKALAIDPHHLMAHVRYGGFLFFVMNDLERALHHYKVAEALRPDSDKTQYSLSRIYRELGKMEMVKQCLSKSLSLNPSNSNALRDYTRFFGDASLSKLDQKSFVLSGSNGVIHKNKIRLFDNADEREFSIFWVHHSEFFLRSDSVQFEQYYLDFKRKGIGIITKIFNSDILTLLNLVEIRNTEHINLIMQCIDTYVIRPYEDFKNWLFRIIADRDLGSELMSLLLRQAAVYSFDSFARNIQTEGKLHWILGPNNSIQSHNIWGAFIKDNL